MSSNSIRIGMYEIAELIRPAWNLLPTAIGCELAIAFNTARRRGSPEDVFAELHYGTVSVSSEKSQFTRLAIANFDEPYVIGANEPGTASAHVSLSSEDLARLEEFRNSEDLFIKINASGWGRIKDDWQRVELEAEARAPKSDWIAALDRCGAPLTIFYEIPFRCSSHEPTIAESVEHIRNAHKQLVAGRYDDAVAYCRDVFEKIFPVYFEKQPSLNDIYRQLQDPNTQKSMEKTPRERAIWMLCYHFTHLGNHNRSADNEKFERAEAQMIVVATANLLSLASKKL